LLRFGWALHVFLPVVSASLVASGVWTSRTGNTGALDALGLACVVAIVFVVFIMAVDLFISHAVMRHRAAIHFGFASESSSPEPYALSSVSLLAGAVVLAWIAAASCTVYVNLRFEGFARIPDSGTSPSEVLEQTGNSLYYTLVSATGVSDAEQVGPVAKAMTALVVVLGSAYFLALFGIVMANIGEAGAMHHVEDHGDTVAQPSVQPSKRRGVQSSDFKVALAAGVLAAIFYEVRRCRRTRNR
jgi:hypothetical protein